MEKNNQISILEVAILEMGRLMKGRPFCPLDVVQWIYPQDWEHFVSDVIFETERLIKEGKVFSDTGLENKSIEMVSISVKFKTT